MSKFFKLEGSSSESSDNLDSDQEIQAPVQRPTFRVSRLSDSDEEAPKRVVRAQKDKIYSELKEKIRLARNARNIKDMTKLLSCFENSGKSYERARVVMARENLTTPRFYIRYLSELESFVNEQWEDPEARKNKKGLSVLRQKLRKYNKDFETEIKKYQEEPDPLGYSSGAAEDDEEEPEAVRPVPSESIPKGPVKKGCDINISSNS